MKQYEESETVEFKESLSLKSEIGETVSAFSNTNRGKIIIGISDAGRIIGVEVGKKTLEGLANYIKQNTDNHIYPKIKLVESIGTKNLIIIEVNEANEKPIFFRGNAYRRISRSNHKLSASEIRKLAKESGKKVYWDEQVCEGTDLDDIDEEKVRWYLEQREIHRNIPQTLKIPLTKFLENIKVLMDGKPTNAGVLFFGKETLLKIPQTQLRLALIKGDDVDGMILDRLDCNGTLAEMTEQAEMFLKKHIPFIGIRTDKSFQREDRFDIPIEALRELIINAVIHRDYETTADVRVFIFDDRVEVINPGNFPDGVSPENPLHKPVNKILSQYMYDIGFIEKYGSGIINVHKLLEENGNKKQEYALHPIQTKVVIYMQSLIQKRGVEKGVEKGVENLTENQKLIICLIKENPKISKEGIRVKGSLTKKTVEYHISKLKEMRILKRIGPDKGGYWEIQSR